MLGSTGDRRYGSIYEDYGTMTLFEEINNLVLTGKLMRHVYVYDITCIKPLNPRYWCNGVILDILGITITDNDLYSDSVGKCLDCLVMERCIDVALDDVLFKHVITEPNSLIDEILNYLYESYIYSGCVLDYRDLKPGDLTILKTYINSLRVNLLYITKNTIDPKDNLLYLIDLYECLEEPENYNNKFLVVNKEINFCKPNQYLNLLVVEKYFLPINCNTPGGIICL